MELKTTIRPALISEGLFIRKTRKRLGYSQIEFAKLLGTSQPRLSKMEQGMIQITIREWFLFCKASGVPVAYYQEFLSSQPEP